MTQAKLERKMNKKQSMIARKKARHDAWEAKGKLPMIEADEDEEI